MTVAYFSPEFGIRDDVPQYSGGLGILAGDHLKASNDIGVDLVGVGLFYREGYFSQDVDVVEGHRERYPRYEPEDLGFVPAGVDDIVVTLAGEEVAAAVWRLDVGRVPLFVLDTDRPGNTTSGRAVTDRLYGGDREHRIRQELVLGVGGVRALAALGIEPEVVHLNEGHAGFGSLERLRQLIVATGLGPDAAIERLRASTVFTTHTPVPAGIDRFPRDLVERYLGGWSAATGVPLDRLMELGWLPGDEPGQLNMAALCLRLSGKANGVSRLHGEVSRQMFAPLWPDLSVEEVPIGSVTNGVHAPTWTSPATVALLEQALGDDWVHRVPERWESVDQITDRAIVEARRPGREGLRELALELLGKDVLDPDALTIGFARRFATYKRATLMLADEDALLRLIRSEEEPVQFVFAGKAHPADGGGKAALARINTFGADHGVADRFVFLPDYRIEVAQAMYAGCDVWLNNPVRPLEACGTSGMKAALNGTLNCSVSDGWWAERAEDGRNGWVIPTQPGDPGPERDQAEALALHRLLADEVVSVFYNDRSRWIEMIRENWRSIGPHVTAARMVRDYARDYYGSAAG